MNQKGQALIEYLLIIVIVSALLITAVKLLGGVIMDKLTEVTCDISGQIYEAGEKAGEATCIDE